MEQESLFRRLCSIPAVSATAVICYFVYCFFRGGLYRYPGPTLAGFTNWWWTASVKSNHHHETMIQLHRKYGDVVRIGPNALSIANVDYIPKIYGINSGFTKASHRSEMYNLFAPRVNGVPLPSLLSMRDEKEYARQKKMIHHAYSLSSLTEYEPLVNGIILKLMDQFKVKSDKQNNKSVDLSVWLRYYTSDVIMQLSFGNNLGFVEQGKDIANYMKELDKLLDLAAIALTMPWLGWVIKHSPLVTMIRKESTTFPEFSRQQIGEHIAENKKRQLNQQSGVEDKNGRPLDLLDRFLIAAQADTPTGYDLDLVISWTLANIMAGADTTAIGLRATVYYLLKTPEALRKLKEELSKANLTYPVTWKESQQLPYLDACIKEAFRLHPAIGLGLERKVPVTGLMLPDGFNLSPGTNVSVNAWVSGRQSIFGPDVDNYVPERWLQGKDEDLNAYKERIGHMKRADLVFGSGTRSCLGKNISLLEIYKIVPTLFLNFDVELVDPSKSWVTTNRWTVRQEGMECWLNPV
ncbi:cytochrome P450 [Sclerotinia borealis F-4128]|uniref:Cytochrome P450 n=1 Tax=Sclerotinia borealis (strain F-4128) TaxID=1432307 RepID=W9CCH6_SCLBF|nr:cytochrome P450 [Sclerotinia borealis F-4128]